ncbi:MAG: hypothetical protein R2844_22125 [Caldilineales bacterium]
MTRLDYPDGTTGHRSRIILVNGSRFLRDMLERVFRKHPDFEIAGVAHDVVALETLLCTTEADWFVVTAKPSDDISQEVRQLRVRFPETRILVIAPDGSEVSINWLEPREVSRNLTPERAPLNELLSMMRHLDQETFS